MFLAATKVLGSPCPVFFAVILTYNFLQSGSVFRGHWRFYQVREFLVGSGYTEVLFKAHFSGVSP
jgi:hypothetical protein